MRIVEQFTETKPADVEKNIFKQNLANVVKHYWTFREKYERRNNLKY